MPSTALAKNDGLGTFFSLALKWKQGKNESKEKATKWKVKTDSIYTAEEKC